MKVCSVCQRCYDDAARSCVESSHTGLIHVRDGGPDLIDGYQLDELVDARPFSQVYKAHQKESGVACRVRITKAEASRIDDFMRNAKTAATVFHPNLAGIYDTGTIGSGEVYIVGEECGGRSLREVLTDVGPPDLLTAIAIVRYTAEALHAIHLSGLVHAAVRPENIVVARSSAGGVQIKLREWDINGVIRSSLITNKFLIESALDVIRYYSPEHFDSEAVDPRSDVYSLGVVYYELLSGSPPFDASTASGLIHLHRNQRPTAIEVNDYNLRMLVMHALTGSLHKDPGSRQPSANALARQLRHIEQLATHSSTPPPAGQASASRVGSSPAIASETRKVTKSAVSRPPRFVDTVGVPIETWQEQRSVARVGEPATAPVVEDAQVEMPAEISSTVTPEIEPLSLAETSAAVMDADGSVAGQRSVAAEVQAPPNRRSRLRSLKRKLNEMSALVAKRHAAVATLLSASEQPVEDDRPEAVPAATEDKAVSKPLVIEKIELRSEAVALRPEVPPQQLPAKEAHLENKPASDLQTRIPVSNVEVPPATDRVPLTREPRSELIASAPASKPLDKISQPKSVKIGKDRTITKLKPVSPAVMAAIREAARANAVQRPATSTPIVIRPDPDEITLVRAARPSQRIRIDIDRSPKRVIEQMPEFVPTIIGVKACVETMSDAGSEGGMFGVYSEAIPASSARYRAVSLGAGLIALAAVFLFANDSLRSLFRPVNPGGDSAAAQATSAVIETAPPAAIQAKKSDMMPNNLPGTDKTPLKVSRSVQKEVNESAKPPKADRQSSADLASKKQFAKAADTGTAKRKTDIATRPRIVKETRQE